MAKNIRGVTVEIGAETKGLNAALKDVRKESRKISRELYQVNRALKFNPDSVELWEQKQELLTGRIEETRKELDALKQAQDEIEKKFKNGEIDDAQYREFKRDIVQAESKLDTFERQLKETQKETSKFGRAMKDISDETKKAGDKLTNIGQNLNQNVTLPLVAAFTALTVGTRDFRKTLSRYAGY
jgi:phage-related minor tail protein